MLLLLLVLLEASGGNNLKTRHTQLYNEDSDTTKTLSTPAHEVHDAQIPFIIPPTSEFTSNHR